MELLTGAIRPYAWGSRTAIAALQGRKMPSDTPEAELWLGAHPADSSTLEDGRSLEDAIAADPSTMLGEESLGRFGPRLPYLLKVLAAEQPLSLQAHPDLAQAAEGFERENAAGVPLGSPERNYVDASHKPELLCAVSDFEALCGFRDPRVAADVIERLDVRGLDSIVAVLRQDDPGQGLREAVTTLLTLPAGHRDDLVGQAVNAAARLADIDDGDDYAMVVDLGKRYPGDAGCVVALLLHHVHLRPGEAIYMPAGNLHAYLNGVGVELMAASDNVLRGGLTRKHIDVPELLRVLRFEVLDDPRVAAVEDAPGVAEWPVPIDEFRLSRVTLDGGSHQRQLPVNGPTVVLCWTGQVHLDDGVAPVTLRPGQAAFVAAAAGTLYVSGFGEIYRAGLGLAPDRTGH
ncbi:MAG TPA: mannose-6-phosphate isomerase, class I [Stackebrandtia sp.]|uniref:mannose-6-phosphate isomerase, class I n=1 Tax=Stackebrandtia sp. TaxID=2023065 RepID=UPI002D5439B4|nr:mannose-6-phosphate isomerase, class I [Stackebrandtia sp.]HZE41540.1 mannose-6-phosphate isomerase, class I [Stackebrandtia sp.]